VKRHQLGIFDRDIVEGHGVFSGSAYRKTQLGMPKAIRGSPQSSEKGTKPSRSTWTKKP